MWTRLAVAIFAMGCITCASARDVNGDLKGRAEAEWFKSLTNKFGVGCCDNTDAHRVEDADWRGETDGTYSVRIDDVWYKLTEEQILTQPNRAGVTIVWVYNGRITCFIPGAGI